MRKLAQFITLFVFCFFVFNSLNAQTVIFSEYFSTATATTPPMGWTVETTIGETGVDVWHFDNPGRRSPNLPIEGNFAFVDSDKYNDKELSIEKVIANCYM